MAACAVGFHDAPFDTTSGCCGFPQGVSNELLEGVGCEPFIGQSFGCCDEVGVLFCGFHWFNRASIARYSLQLPEGKRGKSGFNEVTSTLAVGRNPHVFQSTPRTRTE